MTNIETYKQCAAFINEKTAHESLREFVFGSAAPTHKHIKKHGPIYRILFSGFAVLYTKWLSYSREELKQYKGAHAKNVFKLLFKLYKEQPLNLDVVVYVLAEAQKDVRECGERSFFADLIDKENFCAYSKLYGMISDWRRSMQGGEKTEDELLESLVMLLMNSKWLECVEWDEENVSFRIEDKVLPAIDFILVDENRIEYILLSRSYLSNRVKREYMSLEDFAEKTIIS